MSVDPREILGVGPDADAPEITAAYRRLAKRWHPDRANSPVAADQMALLNAAYTALRQLDEGTSTAAAGQTRTPGEPFGPGRTPADDSLASALRLALGGELQAALEPGETVELVTSASTWASPQTVLAVTDRRLLWLLDDVPVHRVRWLPFAAIDHVTLRPPRPWRRRAIVTCEDRRARRWSFGELPPATAAAIVRRVQANRRPTAERRAG